MSVNQNHPLTHRVAGRVVRAAARRPGATADVFCNIMISMTIFKDCPPFSEPHCDAVWRFRQAGRSVNPCTDLSTRSAAMKPGRVRRTRNSQGGSELSAALAAGLPAAGRPSAAQLPVGARVRVTLGRRSAIGVIVAHAEAITAGARSPAADPRAAGSARRYLRRNCWSCCSGPPVTTTTRPERCSPQRCPAALRAGQPAREQQTWVGLSAAGLAAASQQLPRRAPRQRELLTLLAAHSAGISATELDATPRRLAQRRARAQAARLARIQRSAKRARQRRRPAVASAPPREPMPELTERAVRGRRDHRCGRAQLRGVPAARRDRQRQDRGVPAPGATHAGARPAARWCWCRRSASRRSCSSASARASRRRSRCCIRR